MYNPNSDNVQHVSAEVSPLKPIKELVLNTEKKVKTTEKIVKKPDIEPLLQETLNQYVIFPINHDDMWFMYKELVGNFWSVTETLENLDALSLDYNEKRYMKLLTSIFASPDSRGLVNDNFAEEFCKVIQVTEAKFFFGHQLFVQNIHYEMYNKLLDSYTQSNDEKEILFKIVENYDSLADKRKWILQWKDSHFIEQLIAATCLHGLFFSAIELTVNWLQERSRHISGTHELVEVLQKILYDQELQRDFSCLMISHLKKKPTNQAILETINSAAKVEFNFLINGLNIDLIGIGPEQILEIIDKNTKALKTKIFSNVETNKKAIGESQENQYKENNSKENHQKLVFDEDF